MIDELLAQAKEMGIDEQTVVKLVSDGSQEQTLNGKDN
jgi:hypothetical protein